jgi:hypothetical protein
VQEMLVLEAAQIVCRVGSGMRSRAWRAVNASVSSSVKKGFQCPCISVSSGKSIRLVDRKGFCGRTWGTNDSCLYFLCLPVQVMYQQGVPWNVRH